MADGMDIQAHASTYAKVMGLMKWATAACAIIAAIVIWLIA